MTGNHKSFRMTGYRWRDAPALLVSLVLAVSILTGYAALASSLGLAVQLVILGLCLGYLAGVWVGGRRTDPVELPPLSDRAKQAALEPDGFIRAIKVCRDESGAGLREAKMAVEAFLKEAREGGAGQG